MNTTDKSTNKKKKNREIYIPTLTIILMLLFGIPGLIALHSYRTTLRDCSSEVTGFIEDEHRGNGGSIMHTVEGKYVDSKATRYLSIIVNTDDRFQHECVYVDFGNVGDKVTIHYNPNDSDDYYIDDCINSFDVAVVLLVIGGAMFALSVFLMIYYTIKGDTEEDSSKRDPSKRNAAKKKKLEHKQNAQERMDRSTKKTTKNYTNEHICKEIHQTALISRALIVMLLIGVALVSSSFIRTYRDINADTAIPINNYPDKLDETCYSVIISEKPQDISPEQGIYHDLTVGNDHIIAKHLNMKMVMGMDYSVKLRGKFKRIAISDKESRKIVKEYYQKIGYFDTFKDEEYAYYYLDCSELSLWEELKKNHILGFCFGLAIIIITLYFSYDLIKMFKHIRPTSSGKRYRSKEIDKLANDMDTVWLKDIEVLVTPSSLIGLNRGITVVDYRDISTIKLEEVNHKTKRRKWNTYRIYVKNKKDKNLLLTEFENKYDFTSLTKTLDERYVEYKLSNE